MVLKETPVCDFGQQIKPFTLFGADGKEWKLTDIQGRNGALIIFMCNHCPYVQAILSRLVTDCQQLKVEGIGVVAINANDASQYPEDSFDNMRKLAEEYDFDFPYLYDESQSVAKDYEAICTPDFFGYNAAGELQYRGRLDAYKLDPCPVDAPRELLTAMQQIAKTGKGPEHQLPSAGCSIKWKLESQSS